MHYTFRIFGYQLAVTSLSLISMAHIAYAQQYLPPSRYARQPLPSPSLLYPEQRLPYPSAPAPRISPSHAPVEIAPISPPTPSPSQAARSATTPAPVALMPPSATREDISPSFESIDTLETNGLSHPPDPAFFRRQPMAETSAPQTSPASEPVVMPKPLVVPEPPKVVSEMPPMKTQARQTNSDPLDKETRAILSRIPRGINSPPVQKEGSAKVDRYDPEIEGTLNEPDLSEEEIAAHESMGVQIEVRRPSLDENVALQKAYDALISGQPQIAMQIYKDILRQSPNSEDALFGVATTYHRLGEMKRAKPFYVKLLKRNPDHRDALTNFLSLVAQQSPEEAVSQLENLASLNPDFGAIHAQLGILYDQMGKQEKALDALIRAVRIAPGNIAYKYNLAILYDKYDMVDDATVLYNQLLSAGRSGIPLPTSARDLQERVIFINARKNARS